MDQASNGTGQAGQSQNEGNVEHGGRTSIANQPSEFVLPGEDVSPLRFAPPLQRPLAGPDRLQNGPVTRMIVHRRNPVRDEGSVLSRVAAIHWLRSEDDIGDNDYDVIVEGSYEELQMFRGDSGTVDTRSNEDIDIIHANLRQRKYQPNEADSLAEGDQCCIYQEYVADEDIGKLDCGHEYQVHYIARWLDEKNSCPMCNATALAALDVRNR